MNVAADRNRDDEEIPLDVLLNPDAEKLAISESYVGDALQIVRASRVAQMISEWRAADGEFTAGEKRVGRPRVISDETLLSLLLLAALLNEPMHIKNVAVMLATRLDGAGMKILGLDGFPRGTKEEWYHRLWRSYNSLLKVLDPFPGARHRRLSKSEYDVLKATREDSKTLEKLPRLNAFSDAFIHASLLILPRQFRRWTGNTVVDATFVPVYGKRGTTKRSDSVGWDPDGAWYVREGDHRDHEVGEKGRKRSRVEWGYELEVVSQVVNHADRLKEFPLLILGVRLHKPGHDPVGEALGIYRAIHEAGMPSGVVVGDRIYGSSPAAEQWQGPLRAMGHRLVNDYKIDQLGVQGAVAGAILVEGWWYSPAMPAQLINATIDYRNGLIEWDTWQSRIKARQSYALRNHGKAGKEGHQRVVCPAFGTNATLRCPLKQYKRTARPRIGVLPVPGAHLPKVPDRICRQASVTLKPSDGLKYRQDLRFGTPEWVAAYSRARNTIEGWNAHLKDEAHTALASPGRRRLRGFGAQMLLISLIVAAANVAKTRKWLAEWSETEPDARTPKLRVRPRDRSSASPAAPVKTSNTD